MAAFGETGAGDLLPIGGAEDKTAQRLILREFVRLAGGAAARIVVLPSASAMMHDTGTLYCRLFEALGVAAVVCLPIADRCQANNPAFVSHLDDATGIFMTGGDQLKLLSLIGATPVAQAVLDAHRRGVVVAGTSAGASAMSRQMIAFGRSGAQPAQRMVQLAAGLGLSESLIIDQHFSQRNRLGRLLTAVALNPGLTGVGIDENTALRIRPSGEAEVIGAGTVTVVDGSGMTYTDIHAARRHMPVTVEGVGVRVLYPGERLTLGAPLYA